jgi:hypothetical protein
MFLLTMIYGTNFIDSAFDSSCNSYIVQNRHNECPKDKLEFVKAKK